MSLEAFGELDPEEQALWIAYDPKTRWEHTMSMIGMAASGGHMKTSAFLLPFEMPAAAEPAQQEAGLLKFLKFKCIMAGGKRNRG